LHRQFVEEKPVRKQIVWTTTMACAAFGLTACNRKPASPEVQTTTAYQRSGEPVQLVGCLKRGVLADETFVLLVSKADGVGGTATYQLNPAAGMNLADQVGHQVEVLGKLRAEQVAVSEGGTRERAAKGTSGTPTVETKTDLDVRQVDATSLKPIAATCPP
jgi:hypothetical protein